MKVQKRNLSTTNRPTAKTESPGQRSIAGRDLNNSESGAAQDQYEPSPVEPTKAPTKPRSDRWVNLDLKIARGVMATAVGAIPGLGALAGIMAISDLDAGGAASVTTIANIFGTAALIGGAMHYALPALAISGLHYMLADSAMGYH